MKTKYNTSLLFICLLLALTNSCCKDEENPDVQPSTERYTGDSYGELNSPWVKDEKQHTHQTIWSCIYFGTYPTNEVVSGAFTAVDDYALADGDVIVDASLYQRLQQADWDAADNAVLDGRRYHRINGATAENASTNHEQHYRWGDINEWHYFTYEPIKWRVLNIKGTQAMLLTDRMPDTHPFQNVDEDTNWSLSDLRQWLNSDFLSSAFSSEEKGAILETNLENAPNSYFDTSSGPDTHDYVFILSGNEVFSSPKASDYGFYAGSGFDDPARRFRSTLYAKCRGAWWSPVEGYRGNSFWMMRTSGYNHNYVTYICDFGYIYQQGTAVTCDDAALLPAITIDLSRAPYSVAPSVSCR